MRKKKITFIASSILFSLGLSNLYAAPNLHTYVAPTCLLAGTSIPGKKLATSNALVLIETDDKGLDALIAAKETHRKSACGGFIDVTDDWHANQRNVTKLTSTNFLHSYSTAKKSDAASYQVRYEKQVNQLLNTLDAEAMWGDLAVFTNTNNDQFPDRYANSETGLKAAKWLEQKIKELATKYNRDDITTYTVATGNYKQPSLVIKIGKSNEPAVVIGGHMDTLSSRWEKKPGADDDGSGSMTAMGVARTLIASDMRFKKPIYVVWYAAEELGLVGSSYVVKDFKKKKINVEAVLHFDMTGYAYKNDTTMWLMNDYVDNSLSKYLETLIKTYVKQPVSYTRCGYACSDHASWHNAGYKAAMPFEAAFGKDNPYIHTAQDKMEVLSLAHMSNFAKLGLAFAVELAEPIA